MSFDEADYYEADENKFAKLLDVPEITIETLYSQYKEKDKTILEVMNEQANFIAVHDGYPEFLTFMQGGMGGEMSKSFKATPESEDCGVLDFYSSLDFINRFYSIQEQASQELYDATKPYDASIMSYIDTELAKKSIEEYHRVQKFYEGTETEY